MGNVSKKSKSSKAPVTAVARSKPADKVKYVLILYKPWSERTGQIMNYLCDALNQVGCVAIPSKTGAVDVSEHDDEYVRNRTSQWLMSANNVVLLCIAANQAEQISREAFIDDSGKLPSKMFPLVFGTEIPSQWPECYSLGLADPENVERPNDFETEGLNTLVAAIRGTV